MPDRKGALAVAGAVGDESGTLTVDEWYQGGVVSCGGLSGPATPELQQMSDQAFPS